MTAMAAEFANQIQDSSFYSLGFEERLSMLWRVSPVTAKLTSPARWVMLRAGE